MFLKGKVEISVMLHHQQLQRHHGAEDTNDPEAEEMLATLPPTMWVTHQADVGRLEVAPVTFKISTSKPVHIPQYPIKPQAQPGIADITDSLLVAGVIFPTRSPWTTPIQL